MDCNQAVLSMEFSRQEYWSGLPCPPPGNLPNPGVEPRPPALQADSLPFELPRKPYLRFLPICSQLFPLVSILEIIWLYWLFLLALGEQLCLNCFCVTGTRRSYQAPTMWQALWKPLEKIEVKRWVFFVAHNPVGRHICKQIIAIMYYGLCAGVLQSMGSQRVGLNLVTEQLRVASFRMV